eukprot:CAMPEP_0197843550 /NCGR_PEP_ID=MMETSP1438-20131217/428_1 /TAXON_ID=1461541 /ORGANISM="Pterosperma sp., Strain CCMP1384" /LENGTH=424 /DNA_ID=CAMNT_0043453753 /DNA_START=299 /DNA_END=1573 /DNA_ORIENTATION=-
MAPCSREFVKLSHTKLVVAPNYSYACTSRVHTSSIASPQWNQKANERSSSLASARFSRSQARSLSWSEARSLSRSIRHGLCCASSGSQRQQVTAATTTLNGSWEKWRGYTLWDSEDDLACLGMWDGVEGPSCVWVSGDTDSAKVEELEALYLQARDSYYNGRPLVADEMFDRVERSLKRHQSTLVVKYPRCSLIRHRAYSDVAQDESLLGNMRTMWQMVFGTGLVAGSYGVVLLFNATIEIGIRGGPLESIVDVCWAGVCLLAAAPLVTVSSSMVKRLNEGAMVPVSGACPSCGEEVYCTFERDKDFEADQSSHSLFHSGQFTQRTGSISSECHVCDAPLVFDVSLREGQKSINGDVFVPEGGQTRSSTSMIENIFSVLQEQVRKLSNDEVTNQQAEDKAVAPWVHGRIYVRKTMSDLYPKDME